MAHLAPRWVDVWEPIVERYVTCMDAADAALAGLPRDAQGKLRLTTIGSQGQDVQHPLWRAWLDASRASAAAAAELGLTPRQMSEIENDEGTSIFDTDTEG